MEIKNYVSIHPKNVECLKASHWFGMRDKIYLPDYRKAIILGMGIVFTGILLTCANIMVHKAEFRMKSMPKFQIRSTHLELKQLPKWIFPYTKQIRPIDLPKNLHILKPELTKNIAQAYLRNPWVSKVQEIRKEYPHSIHVKLSLRRPVAWVATPNQKYLSDIHGIRLPVEKRLHEKTNLPVIVGIEEATPSTGKAWQSFSIKAALKVAAYLSKNGILKLFGIRKIVLRKNQEKKQIVLIMAKDIQIIWGENLNSSLPAVSAKQRLQAVLELKYLLPKMENLEDIEEIDIRFGYIIMRKRYKKWRRSRRSRRRIRLRDHPRIRRAR